VELDATHLRAGKEGVMALRVTRNGQPATDLAPYLGVAAHVVLIGADDLAYVHAHALADDSMHEEMDHGGHAVEGMDHSTGHDSHHMAEEPMPAMEHDGHLGGHAHGAGDDAHQAIMGVPGTVPAELSVYVTPPAPGEYGLWIEFVGEDQVVTVPFRIEVPAG